MARRFAMVLWLACASTACGGRDAGLNVEDAVGGSPSVASAQDRLPVLSTGAGDTGSPGTRAAQTGQARTASHAPKVMVEGRGAYADALVERVRAELPEGWRGVFKVPGGCNDDACLHWWMTSADDLQRVEALPAAQVPVLVPEAGELHVDPGIVREHAETIRKRLFPEGRVTGSEYYRYEDRVSNGNITLTIAYVRGDVPMRAEINVWMRLSDPPASRADGDRRTGTLHANVRSAPVDAFDEERLFDVAYKVRLEREGWDAELDECLGRAYMIATMMYVGSDEDSRDAQNGCYRAWEIRRLWRAQAAGATGGG